MAESTLDERNAQLVARVLDELEHSPVVHQPAAEIEALEVVSRPHGLPRAPSSELAASLDRFGAE